MLSKRFFLLLLIAGLGTITVLAQEEEVRRGSRIIDDTTKQIYGPRTSRYYSEEDVFMNRNVLHRVDTSIRNFHRFNDVQRNDNLYQDLGVIGTAIRPIYYQLPEQIGVTSGFNSFDVYWNREEIRYWDTKSPYSNMHVILGGRGRSITRATYSRNINPRWNFGLTYRGMFIDKQISRRAKGDRNVRGQYYHFFTTYQSKDSTYRIFANFRRGNHEVGESGGVRNDVPANFTYKDYFTIDAQPYLTEAINQELRMNIHLYHQYRIGSGLQVYHQLDRYRQSNRFTDRPSAEPDFDFVEIDSALTNDGAKFVSLRNEAGIKGSLSKLFYNGYFALRDYTMTYRNDTIFQGETISNNRIRGTESYVGGRISLNIDSLLDVVGWAELLLPDGNYRIQGTIKSKWLDATLTQMQYEPTFMQQFYRGAHDYWNNYFVPEESRFSSINVTRLSGSVHYRSKVFTFSPGLTFTRIGNYVYFKRVISPIAGDPGFPDSNPLDTDVLPIQSKGENVIASPHVRAELVLLRHVFLRGNAIYTRVVQESEGNPFELPELFVNGQLSYENIFFNGNLDMHAGVDIHWKSAYYALAYDVPTSQFYIQGDPGVAGFNGTGGRNYSGVFTAGGAAEGRFLTPALPNQPNLPVVDVFFNAKIKRGRIFFKYNNLFQAITGNGYFPTPLYPGQRNTLDFGFDWSFYD